MEHAAPGATRPAWCSRLPAEPESRPRTLKLSVFLAGRVTPFQSPQRLTRGRLKECPEVRLGPDQASTNRPASKAVRGLLPVTVRNPKSGLFVHLHSSCPFRFCNTLSLLGIPDEPRSGFSYPIRLEAGSSPVQSRLRQLSPVTARALFTHGRQLLMSAFLWKPLCSRLLSAPSYTSGNRSSERLSVLSEATPRVRTVARQPGPRPHSSVSVAVLQSVGATPRVTAAAWQPGPRPHSFLFCDHAAERGGHTAGEHCSLAAWPMASLFSVLWPRCRAWGPHRGCRLQPGSPAHGLTLFCFCGCAAGRGGHTAGEDCSLAAWQPGPRPHSFLFLWLCCRAWGLLQLGARAPQLSAQ